MNKLWRFLRSMRFGILLMALIAVCSVLGSVIPQGKEVAWYAQTYRGAHGVILLLGLHRIFTSWYFVALLALLCLNLTLCSVVRVGALSKGGGNAAEAASRLPGEALTMPDGTEIAVDGFSIEDGSGRLDYASTLPDGRSSGWKRVSVNDPMSFGPYKVYQQTYGTAGSVTVTNLENDGSDDFTLTEPVFLSADGRSGLWYEALYPGYIRDPGGNMTLVANTAGHYENPVYQVQVASDGVYTPTLAFPGDSVQVNGLMFTFNEPVEYPGLRIKRTPAAVNALLIAAFALMTVGLYITFFLQPVLVKLDAEGYAVGGPKPEGMRMELALLLKDDTAEDNT